jgi:hypothetical protein
MALSARTARAAASTAEPSWGPVLKLPSRGRGINHVRTAVGPDGTYTVVWVEERAETPSGWNHRVMAVDVDANGASEPVVLGGMPGSSIEDDEGFGHLDPEAAGGLQIAIDNAGLTTVVWSESRSDDEGRPIWGPNVLEVHRADGGEWSVPAELTSRFGIYPKLITSPTGHAVVVWSAKWGYSSYRAPGGQWQTPVRAPAPSTQLSIGMTNTGVAVAAAAGQFKVRVSRLVDDGSRWVEQTALGEGYIGSLDLAVNGRGEAVVAWERHWGPPHGEGWSQVESASRSSGGRWGRVRHVSPPRRGAPELQPNVVLDRRGRAVATWAQGEESFVKVARRSASGAWRMPVTLGRGALPKGFGPQNLLAHNRRGDTLVCWLVRRDRVARIDAAYRPGSGPWRDIGPVSGRRTQPRTWEIGQADATVTPGGNIGIAWPSSGRSPTLRNRLFFRELTTPNGP